ncbi:hypothetical protein ES703_111709 [subsurface metagenome]
MEGFGVHSTAQIIDCQFHQVAGLVGNSGNFYWPELTAIGFNGVGNDICNCRYNLSRVYKNVLDVLGSFDSNTDMFYTCLSAGQLYSFIDYLLYRRLG